jgi:two-component system sensor histidine kinase DegS
MERQRIAREIHDGPAQAIANVVLRLEIVNKVYEKNPASVPEELTKMKELAQIALNEIRGFIFDLRPMTLQDLGLAATIKRVIHTMNTPEATLIQFILEGDEREIQPDVKLALFRIAQESLNNMRKHAKAKSCWVHLKYLKDKVVLIVEDDGQGFDESKVADYQRKYISFGLLGMRERADDIGASFEISSKPGEGTKVTLIIMDKP